MTTDQYIRYLRESIELIRSSKTYGEAAHNIGRARGQLEILFASFLLSHEDFNILTKETDAACEKVQTELKGGYL